MALRRSSCRSARETVARGSRCPTRELTSVVGRVTAGHSASSPAWRDGAFTETKRTCGSRFPSGWGGSSVKRGTAWAAQAEDIGPFMTPDANGTIREALLAGLRDALEPEPQNGAGRGGGSRATKLAAGAALAAAATPLAKRGSTTLRTSSGGRVLRMAVDRSGLPEKAARRITDANRAVQDWTARQQHKRGVLTSGEAASAAPSAQRRCRPARRGTRGTPRIGSSASSARREPRACGRHREPSRRRTTDSSPAPGSSRKSRAGR